MRFEWYRRSGVFLTHQPSGLPAGCVLLLSLTCATFWRIILYLCLRVFKAWQWCLAMRGNENLRLALSSIWKLLMMHFYGSCCALFAISIRASLNVKRNSVLDVAILFATLKHSSCVDPFRVLQKCGLSFFYQAYWQIIWIMNEFSYCKKDKKEFTRWSRQGKTAVTIQ